LISFRTLREDGTIIKPGIASRLRPPAVSVVMPTYCRGESTLRRAVDSVLAQSFGNFEFIVVDDGSRDGTFDILRSYRKRDPRMTIIRHERNSGLPAARVNEAILRARGTYIAYQFDDDAWEPTFLETLYGEARKRGESCAVYGTCAAQIRTPRDGVVQVSYGRPFDYGALQSNNYIANNSILHPKAVFELCGLFDPHVVIRRLSDYDLWLRMARFIPFVWVDRTVSRVFGGEKNSLAEADGTVLKQYGKLRKYIETDRCDSLKPANIDDYEVDELALCRNAFTQREIDELNRKAIIPYRSRTTYYLTEEQRHMGNISRPALRTLGLSKGAYSTSIDVTVKNYTHRIGHFPYAYFFVGESLQSLLELNDCDLFALYRTVGDGSSALLNALQAAGKPTLYFMDDNMFKFHELGQQFGYLNPGTQAYRNLERQVAGCDLVVSYSPVITADCRRYNANVAEVATNIPNRCLNGKKEKSGVAVKYAILSGPSRMKEMAWLFPVLKRFAQKRRGRVEFHFWGIDPGLFGTLPCKTYYTPFTDSYDQYLARLETSRFDYTLCPLDGKLAADISKSPVKLLEGAAAGAVLICSDVLPYAALPDDVCMKVDNSPEAWLDALERAAVMSRPAWRAIFDKALGFIKRRFTSEAQAHRMLGVLESAELLHKLNGAIIAYFFHEAYLGGATLHLLKHAGFMKAAGFNVLLCLPANQRHIADLAGLAAELGVSLQHLPYVSSIEVAHNELTAANVPVIARWLQDNRVGLVHSLTYIEAVGFACQQVGIPHAATLHQFYGSRLTREEIRSAKLIDRIHSSSDKYADMWSQCLETPAIKICCPVDEAYFDCFEQNRVRLREKPQTIQVLLSGTVQPRKNQLEAIEAVKLLADRGYEVGLTIIGYTVFLPDYVQACEQLIADYGLQARVTLSGFERDPLKHYRQADLLLCCSLDESMPQTILQAMAAGVPVVSTEVGGVRETVKDRSNGILFEGTDAASIALGLEKAIMLLGSGKVADMLDNAHHSARMIAHPDFVRSELFHLYNETMKAWSARMGRH